MLLFLKGETGSATKAWRLWSPRGSALMSCLVSEARQGAGMAAEKIRGVRGGGRQQAAWEFLARAYAAPPEPGAGGEGAPSLPGSAQRGCGPAVSP